MAKKKIKGVGDIISKVTEAIGIIPCASCEERRKKWNLEYPLGLKPREITKEDIENWNEFMNDKPTLSLNNDQRIKLCVMYANVFQVPYYEPCVNCSPKPYITMIERLDSIMKVYKE